MSSSDRQDSSSRKRARSPSTEPENGPSGKAGRKDSFDPFLAEDPPPEELEQPDVDEESQHDEPQHDEPEHDEPEDDEPEDDEPEQDEPEHDQPEHDQPEQDEPEPDEPERDEPEQEAPQQHDTPDAGNEPEASPPNAPATPAPERPDPLPQKPKVVLMTGKVAEPVLRDPVRTGSAILAAIGGALCLLWLTEMLLLWFPLYLQNPAWTFGTVVQTVDILPSAAVGSALMTYGLIRLPGTPARMVRRLSTVFVALAGFFLLITFFYIASLPASFAQAPDVSVQPLRRTVVHTIAALLIAAATCAGVAALLWRGVGKSGRAVGRDQPR